jgi:hypothetical protein
MSGPQFVHVQTWSRKANPAGQSVSQIIAEAMRDPEHSAHVDDPAPPRPLVGDPSTFQAEHDAHVAARSTVVQMKDGSERERAIRRDRHTLASVVMSYPVPRAAIETDEQRVALERWEQRNIDWLRDTYGDQLRVVVAHDDEEHPHLHAWLLPDDPGADATTLHPGKQAKRETEAQAKADGIEPREVVKLGNRALKDAMTTFQDEYHESVGAPLGLTRSGPQRRRLTREQWKAEKATAAANAASLTRAENADEKADQIDAERDRLRRLRSELDEQSLELEDREDEIRQEKSRLRSLANEMNAAYKAAKQVLSDVRAAQHLPRDVRKSLSEGIRDLRDALQPRRQKTEREQINQQIVSQSQSPAPDSDSPENEM